jgi:hypothetical protein
MCARLPGCTDTMEMLLSVNRNLPSPKNFEQIVYKNGNYSALELNVHLDICGHLTPNPNNYQKYFILRIMT